MSQIHHLQELDYFKRPDPGAYNTTLVFYQQSPCFKFGEKCKLAQKLQAHPPFYDLFDYFKNNSWNYLQGPKFGKEQRILFAQSKKVPGIGMYNVDSNNKHKNGASFGRDLSLSFQRCKKFKDKQLSTNQNRNTLIQENLQLENKKYNQSVGKIIVQQRPFQKRDQEEVKQVGDWKKEKKVGIWNYYWNQEQIGGGSYDEEGNQKKIGKWVELDEGFNQLKQVTFNGEYNMNNMKVGRWDIMYCEKGKKEYKQIGGGSYDLEGNQKKIGKWIELCEGFCRKVQVTYYGEYNNNGRKVGRWNRINLQYQNNLSGCINFDEDGNEIYRSENQNIIFVGSFNNSNKVGRWDIMCKQNKKEYQQIIFKSTNKYIQWQWII